MFKNIITQSRTHYYVSVQTDYLWYVEINIHKNWLSSTVDIKIDGLNPNTLKSYKNYLQNTQLVNF